MTKLSSPLLLSTLLLPLSLAACTESFSATGGSAGATTTTSGTAGTTNQGGTAGSGGATGGSTGGQSTGGATGGQSTGGSTGGTGGGPMCQTPADCDPPLDCIAGTCQCPTGTDACGNACVDLKHDPQNCGSCGSICAYSCVGGNCNDPVDIAAGGQTTCAVLALGDLYCWGNNLSGQFGAGAANVTSSGTPVKVPLTAVTRVFVGRNGDNGHVCAITAPGDLYCWGSNQAGKTGTNPMDTGIQPVKMVMGSPATTGVGLGQFHSVSLSNGDVRGWGANDADQLGFIGMGSPTPVGGSNKQGQIIAAGGGHTCVIDGDKLYCWGRNVEGQIGVISAGLPVLPTEIDLGEDTAVDVALGDAYTCTRTNNHTVRCWGLNDEGQLGIGSNAVQTAPGPAANLGGASATSVFAGQAHTAAIAGGDLYVWGRNNAGQVSPSSGSLTISTPLKTPGLHTVVQAALGVAHTCVRDSSGGVVSVYCWGKNNAGQVGDGSIGGTNLPPTKVLFP